MAHDSRIIDGDGHIIEDLEAIYHYLPAHYRGYMSPNTMFPPLDHLHSGRATTTPPQRNGRGKVGPKEWGDFLEDVGIDATVLYPTSALAYGKMVSIDYAVELCRAYNNWLHDTYLKVSPVFKGMALIPMQDPTAAVEELRRVVRELGMVGAMIPSNGLHAPVGSPEYFPIYAEAERLGTCLAIHGGAHDRFGMDQMNMYVPVHALGHPFGLMIACGSVVFNGIFERFPNVRVGFMEGGVAWLLLCLERFEASHATHFQYQPPGQFGPKEGEKADKYVIRHIKEGRMFVGCEGEEKALAYAVKLVGNTPFMYSSDYPHEVTNESCKEDLEELRGNPDLSEAAKRAILRENASRFYSLRVPVA